MYTQHPILTEKHRIVDIFADLLKKKNWNITCPKYSDPLLSILVEAPFWFNTAMSLFGKDATSFSHLDLGILCHSSLQILSSSVRLDGKRWWTAIFRSLCLGSLSCWKVNLRPSLRYWALWRRFSSRISLYLAAFIFPSIATSRPVPAAEKHPHSMMLPTTMLHCWDCIGQVMSSAWFSPHIPLRIKAKSSILVSSDQRILQVFFSKLHAGFHVSCTEERLPSGHSAIKPRLVEGCSDGWLSTTFSHLPNASLELSTVIFGFYFTSLTKALLPW